MLPPHFDYETPWGGRVRLHPGGRTEVLRRDFNLTWEPDCSDEAHAQMAAYVEAVKNGLTPPGPTPPPPPLLP